MNKLRKGIVVLIVCFVFLMPMCSYAQELDTAVISIVKVADNIYMLQKEKDGNIGVCIGDDGVFMIDSQSKALIEQIETAVAKISDKKIRFLLNTHWHFDHMGGNESMGKAGVTIIAHENVRQRMSMPQFMSFFKAEVPAAPAAALPVITFTSDLDFHLNQENIHISHIAKAHTDGDAIVFFKKENVLLTGDIYFSGIYPFIDTDAQGSVDGMIAAVTYILSLIDEQTKIIPGHGPLSTKKDLIRYVEMLSSLREKISQYILEGKSLEEIQALKPSKEFDAEWGNGFLSPDKFVQLLFEDLSYVD